MGIRKHSGHVVSPEFNPNKKKKKEVNKYAPSHMILSFEYSF
jgi:hypothetical protein